MPRISVPADRDPLMFLWSERATALSSKAAAFSDAVYSSSTLPLREFEAARTRIAQINDCQICRQWRTSPGEVPEEFYANVGANPSWEGFNERERLAAEFAERFALDHLSMDDDVWARLHAAFTDDDGACRIPIPGH